MPEIDRRDFLKLVGASAGAAATAGCSDPVQKLIPYVVQPEEITPGIATYYASTCQECPAGCGLHVKTREGRPIKLEGNPDHPINQGALCARGQASIGRSYHPDRYPGPMRRSEAGALEPIGWDEAIALLAERIGEAPARTWLLGGETGPTASAAIERWVTAVGVGGRAVYEPFAPEALREASRQLFGAPAEPHFDLSDADLILDFGSDLIESGPSPVEHARQLARARDASDPERRGHRMISFGPRLSTTASNADEWIAIKPGTEGLVALALARIAQGGATDGALGGLLAPHDARSVAAKAGIPAETLERIGRAVARAEQAVALPPGAGLASRRATATAGAVLVLNQVVGAVGSRVRFPATAPAGKRASYRETLALVDAMKTGKVAVLLVHHANPVYSLPPSAGFGEGLAKVPFVVSFATAPDETSERAHLVLPDHAPLESWGDSEPRVGVRSLIQPALRPLFDTRAVVDTLLDTGRALGAPMPEGSFRSLVEQAWSDADWDDARARGGVFDAEGPGASPAPAPTPAEGAPRLQVSEPALEGDGEFVLVASPSPLLYDGRSANLPWLQEIPDPVTKVAWWSWAEISLGAAERLGGLSYGDVVAVQTPAGRLEVPVIPRGGVRDDVVYINVGQGHTVGRYAAAEDGEPRGVNVIDVLPALTDESGGRAWLVARAALSPTGRHRRLPFVQTSQDKRMRQLGETVSLLALARGEVGVEAGESHGEAGHGAGHGDAHGDGAHGTDHGGASDAHGGGHDPHHYKPFDASKDASPDSPYRWGMVVDLDRCNGCSACIAACYIENNIPVVGETQTLRGRNMAWLRIERWVGEGSREGGGSLPILPDESGPEVDIRHSPMMCQQCGAAPCEPVCPVIATYHNEDGLNGMIYNRCIGTRYCSNNCPYKVRKYNWYDFALERWPDPLPLMANPDVTLRSQGVMEKCTFCVQRIATARQGAKDAGRPIADGGVITACAQSCPTEAITFGNLKDAGSAVSRLGSDELRGYHAYHELNTRPAVTYLKQVHRGPVEG